MKSPGLREIAMPIFTPARRWQKAYYPFKKRRLLERAEETFERSLKGFLWGCRMCGNCLLQETAFICPMACPKGLRNGPCGGSKPGQCCVDPSRPCIWYAIFERAEKMGRMEKLLEVLPPLDWNKTGTSALHDVYIQAKGYGLVNIARSVIRAAPGERVRKWDRFFSEIRQPDWWAGDAVPHNPPFHEPVSGLERVLSQGRFAITCELVPPPTNSFHVFDKKIGQLKGLVDGVNITDSPSATPHISSLVCAIRAAELGMDPILQMVARDRTRIGFQGDVLGAAASGIRNLLFITGDHPSLGQIPYSRMDIWDFDSVQAVWMARKMRDEGVLLDGRRINDRVNFFIGAGSAPFAMTPRFQALKTEKKVNAGAQFLQTNLVYDLPKFEAYLEALDKRDVLKRVHLLAGVAPIRNIRAANYLAELPGVEIPNQIMARLRSARDVIKESHQINLEIIEQLKSLPGVDGIHLMAIVNTDDLKRLLKESGLRGHTPEISNIRANEG